jgi:hypothetical protein
MPYLIKPQRLEPDKGYVECKPHQATRIALFEQHRYPAKRGRKAYTVSTLANTFVGADALRRAEEACERLNGRPSDTPRSTLYRSLTRAEYEKVVGQ